MAGLRAALEKGSQSAVKALGRATASSTIRACASRSPPSAQRGEKLMRRLGMGKYADELVVTLNRAAEQAVPEARQLLVESVTQDERARTRKASSPAATRRAPSTSGARTAARCISASCRSCAQPTAKVELAAGVRAATPTRRPRSACCAKEDADLDEYVTQKALDGLYLMVGEEEKKIREDPLGRRGSQILTKVFGALRYGLSAPCPSCADADLDDQRHLELATPTASARARCL